MSIWQILNYVYRELITSFTNYNQAQLKSFRQHDLLITDELNIENVDRNFSAVAGFEAAIKKTDK